jgi:hypothetical protein
MVQDLVGPDGKVKYQEFVAQLLVAQKGLSATELEMQFRQLDADGSGKLNHREIQELFGKPEVAHCLDGRSPHELISEMDKNNDGEIDFEEFKAAVLGENGDHSKYQVGESLQYLSTTHDKWFDAKVVAVDARSGSIQINLKPNAWITLAEQANRTKRDEAKISWSLGETIEYFSTTHQKWFPCTITQLGENQLQVSIKPGQWVHFNDQRLRKQAGGSGDSRKGDAGRMLLQGAFQG